MRLEEETHPPDGTAVGKDQKSRLALLAAEDLVKRLAGWAIDHQIGLVVNGLPGGAAVPVDGKQTDTQRQADDHRHEDTASEYDFADPTVNRRILAALLTHGPGPFPISIIIEATDALIALDMGETRPFVRPTRGVGKESQAYTKWILRYWAVMHVEFLRGMNYKREDALSRVANAYGVGIRTIETWVSEIPKKLKGIRPVREMKSYARQVGKNAHEIMFSSGPADRNERIIERIMSKWGDDALTRRGNEFRQVERDTVGSVIQLPR